MQKTRLRPAPLIAACCMVAAAASFHSASTVPYMDDWDYAIELSEKSLLGFLFVVNPAGQFNPVSKLLYGSVLLATKGSFLTLIAVNTLVRAASLGLVLATFRRLGVLSFSSAFVASASALSYVGFIGVFAMVIQGGQELAFLFLAATIYILVSDRSEGALGLLAIYLAEVAASLSWANGLVTAFVIPTALIVAAAMSPGGVRSVSRRVLACLVAAAVTVLLIRGTVSVGNEIMGDPRSPEFPAGFATYFAYGGVINGALSGLNPGTLPGWFHLLFFLGLTTLGVWVVVATRSMWRRFVALTLITSQVVIALLTAFARWPNGAEHATSYRYVYNNVFLELALLGLILGVAFESLENAAEKRRRIGRGVVLTIAVAILAQGAFGQWRARLDWARDEARRRDCLAAILQGSRDPSCVAQLYYRNDPDYLVASLKAARTLGFHMDKP